MCNCDLWFYSYVVGFCMWNLLIWFGYLGLNVWKLGASFPCWGEQDLLCLRFNSPKEERELISVVKQWADFCGALISTCKLFHHIVRKSKIELLSIVLNAKLDNHQNVRHLNKKNSQIGFIEKSQIAKMIFLKKNVTWHLNFLNYLIAKYAPLPGWGQSFWHSPYFAGKKKGPYQGGEMEGSYTYLHYF